jgi:hypothetical protein
LLQLLHIVFRETEQHLLHVSRPFSFTDKSWRVKSRWIFEILHPSLQFALICYWHKSNADKYDQIYRY